MHLRELAIDWQVPSDSEHNATYADSCGQRGYRGFQRPAVVVAILSSRPMHASSAIVATPRCSDRIRSALGRIVPDHHHSAVAQPALGNTRMPNVESKK